MKERSVQPENCEDIEGNVQDGRSDELDPFSFINENGHQEKDGGVLEVGYAKKESCQDREQEGAYAGTG